MRTHSRRSQIIVGVGLLICLATAACSGNTQNLEATVAAQSTWIAHLATQIGDQTDTNRLQWDAISQMATQIPPAVQIVTPVSAGTTNIPTEIPSLTPIRSVYLSGAHSDIPEVDSVIDTVLNGSLEDRLELVQLTQTACTNTEGLGGPPKCEAGEAEGTLVQAFPVAYSEGVLVRLEGIADLFNFDVEGLLGVYQVPPDAYQDEYWPAGDYGVVFAPTGFQADYVITFLVKDGKIVRLNYDYGEWSNSSLLDRWNWVMPPPQG